MEKTLLFSYGSNSLLQLRARVLNPSLEAFPAHVNHYTRIFCHSSPSWGGGAVASIRPLEGGVVYGSIVPLSNEEFHRLDAFEAGYSKTTVKATISSFSEKEEEEEEREAITYVCDNVGWKEYPTEQYLTAIHVHLRQHYCSSIADSIPILSVENDEPEEEEEGEGRGRELLKKREVVVQRKVWSFPGLASLSLPAAMVEINAQRIESSCSDDDRNDRNGRSSSSSSLWVMPRKIGEICSLLSRIQITTTMELTSALQVDGSGESLNARLASVGTGECFAEEDLALFVKCLLPVLPHKYLET